jgi:hypothetical protein
MISLEDCSVSRYSKLPYPGNPRWDRAKVVKADEDVGSGASEQPQREELIKAARHPSDWGSNDSGDQEHPHAAHCDVSERFP